jgi:WD40 repeat protein
MKKFSILVAKVFLLIMLTSCVGNGPASTSDSDTIATIAAETLTALPSATPAPSLTAALSQPKHEYVVYGVKTVVYSMSDYDANQQNLPLYQYINQHTDIFSYSVEQHNANLLFSDETLPIFILNTSGGGETAIHDIVAASPTSGKLYARMIPRDQYTSYQVAGSLYELSTDGTNSYQKLFDFDSPVNFALSPDGTKIAYISDNSLVVRALDSGDEIGRMDLDEYKYNWITTISWAPDSKTILMDIAAGEASVTPVEPYTTTNGCYLVNIDDMTMNKLSDPLFQYPLELIPGFMMDPFSYSYFPRSNRLIGIARKYDETNYSVELYSVDLEGSNLVEIPIGNNEAVWEVNISPNEQYIAYPCLQNVCVTHIQDNLSEVVSQPAAAGAGVDQEQTVIGWLEK